MRSRASLTAEMIEAAMTSEDLKRSCLPRSSSSRPIPRIWLIGETSALLGQASSR